MEDIFRGAFSPTVFPATVKKKSSQRSGQYLSTLLDGLVMFWSLPWETQIEMSHYASEGVNLPAARTNNIVKRSCRKLSLSELSTLMA